MSGPDPRETRGADELASGPEGTSAPSSWVLRLIGLVAVVVFAFVAGPDLLSSPAPTDRDSDATPSAEESDPADVVPPVVARRLEPLRWATRGDAPDSVFAAAALQQLRRERPDVDRLLWSGTLSGHDHVALVSYKPSRDAIGGGIEIGALRVGPDDVLATATPLDIGTVRDPDGLVAAAWRGADGRSRMVLLGRPARLAVQVSPSIDYHRDGSISRHWLAVDSDDGSAVLDLGRDADNTAVVRTPNRSPQNAFLVPVVDEVPPTDDEFAIEGVDDPGYAGPRPDALIAGVTESLDRIFDVRDAAAKVIWSGPVRGGDDETIGDEPPGRGALVRLRRGDGAVFQSFVFTDRSGEERASTANPVPWSVGDLLPCTFSTFEPGSPLMLFNPSGKGTVTVTLPSATPVPVHTDADGAGVLWAEAGNGPNFGGARVVVRDARGHVLLRSSLVDQVGIDGFASYL